MALLQSQSITVYVSPSIVASKLSELYNSECSLESLHEKSLWEINDRCLPSPKELMSFPLYECDDYLFNHRTLLLLVSGKLKGKFKHF